MPARCAEPARFSYLFFLSFGGACFGRCMVGLFWNPGRCNPVAGRGGPDCRSSG
jgi:hypothetical protein